MFDILEDLFCESIGKAIDGTGKLLDFIDTNNWNDDDDDDNERRARRRKHELDSAYKRHELAYHLEQARQMIDQEERQLKALKRERSAMEAELAQQELLMRDNAHRLDQLQMLDARLGKLSFRRWGLGREIKAAQVLQRNLDSQVASLRSGLSELGFAIKARKTMIKELTESMRGLEEPYW